MYDRSGFDRQLLVDDGFDQGIAERRRCGIEFGKGISSIKG